MKEIYIQKADHSSPPIFQKEKYDIYLFDSHRGSICTTDGAVLISPYTDLTNARFSKVKLNEDKSVFYMQESWGHAQFKLDSPVLVYCDKEIDLQDLINEVFGNVTIFLFQLSDFTVNDLYSYIFGSRFAKVVEESYQKIKEDHVINDSTPNTLFDCGVQILEKMSSDDFDRTANKYVEFFGNASDLDSCSEIDTYSFAFKNDKPIILGGAYLGQVAGKWQPDLPYTKKRHFNANEEVFFIPKGSVLYEQVVPTLGIFKNLFLKKFGGNIPITVPKYKKKETPQPQENKEQENTIGELTRDKIVLSVMRELNERSKVGIKKYGTTLEENNSDDFFKHLQEELMDAVLYLEKLKQIREQKANDGV